MVKRATENVKETEASAEHVKLMAALERALRRSERALRRQEKGTD